MRSLSRRSLGQRRFEEMPLTAAHSITPTTSGSAALSPTEITMALRTPPLARSTRTNDKDAPLREDIRLLGRLLGEVIRQQEGEAVFKVVETIRQTAVRFRRESDLEAGADLDRLLKKLSRDQTNAVVRAFSYFSHLANIAEDQHHNRRRRAYLLAGSAPQLRRRTCKQIGAPAPIMVLVFSDIRQMREIRERAHHGVCLVATQFF